MRADHFTLEVVEFIQTFDFYLPFYECAYIITLVNEKQILRK